MINLKLKTRSIAMALTLLSVALTGCVGTEESTESPEHPDNNGELGEWGVYYTASISDLPDCTDEHSGKLYYIGEDSGFVTCSEGIWEEISLAGEQGPQGPAGADGADGQDGADGAQGPQGPAGADGADGADGTSFTVQGTVEDRTELGDVYIGDIGDAFLVNSTSHIFVWDGGSWIDLGSISGPQGPAGADGADGAQGPQGPAGADGSDGADGAQGPQGPQGPAGADGSDGADGADGAQGPQGPAGSMPVVMEMTVTVSSMKYFVDGIQQGTLTLYRGFTYNFDLSSVPSFHPFKLGTSANGNQYTSGVATNGNIMSFTVPLDAPNTLYYYCQNHSNMGGTITIDSLGSVS